ncbi:capsule biosynthesis protein [Olivibacter sp. LS-1]|uniref:SLBB domain-containing protein n=1 Tax=Olivibacter sp. LS-1 TaxID=2592345 RepID=UPI0011EA85E4|nr:SLBB domain-containing protein [Olivibacter sp. LS-1]QEL00349.1 capsule biosynthesis protein [Olivibacter sp. LS-1]
MYKRIILYCFFSFCFFLLIPSYGYAQNLSATDLSMIKVDDLTDDQLRAYLQQANASGMTQEELMQMAVSSGMPSEEIEKLTQRLQTIQEQDQALQAPATNTSTGDKRKVGRQVQGATNEADTLLKLHQDNLKSPREELRIFGADIFQGSNTKFEPNLRMATPKNYVIGADDELLLELYGNSEASYSLTVSPEGAINIPYVGVVPIAGITIEQAIIRIKDKMRAIYSGLRNGSTRLNVSVGNIRSIRVIVTGEVVKPGTYTLPSVATAFNALYAAGGPNDKGTMRQIKIIRNDREESIIDVYDFLLNGSLRNNIVLQDQDIIQVAPYLSRVEIRGRVKRPAIFELKEGETFDQLLTYAGGFDEEAYRTRITVFKNTATERRVEDVLASQFGVYLPQSGDKYRVGRILDRYTNRVRISGAVFRPGVYELSQGLTLSMLIKKADGVKEDAFMNRGYITRLKENLEKEQVAFSVADILAGTQNDIPLKREDEVVISSIFDLKTAYKIQIDGEVRNAGTYDFAEGMTLKELIVQAGGFTEAASAKRIEIARRIKESNVMSQSAHTSEIYHVNIERDLSGAEDFVLQPFDVINVRLAKGYQRQRSVRIEGEILYPGQYILTRKDERVSDLIKRAGGFTAYAYTDGASLKRKSILEDELDSTGNQFERKSKLEQERFQERVERLNALQKSTINPNELGAVQRSAVNNSYVGINMNEILRHPEGSNDLILEEGDVLHIPKQLQTVRVSGEVLSPVTVIYSSNKGFKEYISQAGGFSERALKKRAYVVYANGSARSTSKFLFFNNYPKIKPGAEIFVPQREARGRISAAQWIGLGGSLATTVGVIVALFR